MKLNKASSLERGFHFVFYMLHNISKSKVYEL